MAKRTISVSADTTLDLTVGKVRVTTGSSNITITLPSAVDIPNRFVYTITKVDSGAGAVVVDGAGSETINGATTFTLYGQYDAISIFNDGAGWGIISGNNLPLATPSVKVGTADLGTVRTLTGSVTANYAGSVTAGTLTAVRGAASVASGTTITGQTYIYGTQGKLTVAGTLNGSEWVFGVVGQLDISAATLTAGSHIGALWGDAGTTGPAVTASFADLLVLTNTTATTFNSLVYAYGKAGVVFDLSSNSSACLDASSTAGGSVIGHILVKINGVAGVLRVYNGS